MQAVTLILRVQCVEHSQFLALSLTSILRHGTVNIWGITQAGDRRLSRPPAKPPWNIHEAANIATLQSGFTESSCDLLSHLVPPGVHDPAPVLKALWYHRWRIQLLVLRRGRPRTLSTSHIQTSITLGVRHWQRDGFTQRPSEWGLRRPDQIASDANTNVAFPGAVTSTAGQASSTD